jgi:lysylphosphatidylglycerol synthetase-like protein (DUF2156 family)
MNWKIILQLSLFGLIMAFGTVSLIPEKIEPLFWLVIFIFCAYIIAKVCSGKYFLHGFMLSIFNSVWITAVHAIFVATYIKNHPDMSPANMHMPAAMYSHPRELMVIMGPIFGAIFGLFQGLFAFVASKIVKKPAPTTGV